MLTIRTVAELSNEEAGEHFTPREVIDLMVDLLITDEDELHRPGKVVTVYDPTCGTGGMLTTAEARLQAGNPAIRVHLRGQEVQPESFAVCSSDMLIRNEKTAQVRQGDTLVNDRFPNNPAMRVQIAEAMLGVGRLAEASAEIDAILAEAPDFAPAHRVKAAVQRRRAGQDTP